ncbi:MAG: hypothetical protein K0Q87_4092 [Neobacillus sp.]|jgi:hypothetical protein|nr:hypothetical protein [Neobacillus sp.]
MDNGKELLGVILCKYCNMEIESFVSEKVVTYFGACSNPECQHKLEKQMETEE